MLAYLTHAGSVAYGAFLIPIIRVLRILLYFISKRLKAFEGKDVNAVFMCIGKIGDCCLNCFEKVFDYLSESAYCYQAVSGKNFIPSAYEGFLLDLKYGTDYMTAKTIAKIFIFLGKIALTVGNSFSLIFVMKFITKDKTSTVWGPVILVALITFITSTMILSLLDDAVMAMLTCRCFDLDMNNNELLFGPKAFHARVKQIS